MIRIGPLARNVFSNWLVLGANVVFALVITPVIVKSLAAERYGVWSFLNGLLAYSELLYLGLGSGFVRFVAQYRARRDDAGINRLTSIVASIYLVSGLFGFLILLSLSPVIPHAFAEPLSPPVARAASVTCVLLGVRLLTIFVGSLFSGVILGHDRFDVVNGVGLASVVLRSVATPLLLAASFSPLLALAWLTVAIGVFDVVAFAAAAYWLLPSLSVRPTLPRMPELKSLYSFGLQSFFILLAVRLISYTDTAVIGLTLGASSVALYVLPLQLVEYSRLTIGGFAGVFLPRVAVLHAQGDSQGLRDTYLRSARVACFLAGWLGGLLITLGPAFLSAWVGPDYGTPVVLVVTCLALGLFAQVLTSQVPLAFYQALQCLRFPAVVLMGEAVMNLGMSVVLVRTYGLTGVAVSTLIPAILSLTILPSYLCRMLDLPVATLVRAAIAPGIAMLVLTVLLEFALGVTHAGESYFALIVRALTTLPLAIGLVAWTFPVDDPIRQLIQRRATGSGAS